MHVRYTVAEIGRLVDDKGICVDGDGESERWIREECIFI